MKVILYKCKINVSAVGLRPKGLKRVFWENAPPPPAFSQGLDVHPSYLSDPPLKWSHFMSYDTFNYNMAIK